MSQLPKQLPDLKTLKDQEDILYLTSQELQLSQQKVKFVIDNFWSAVRFFITRPERSQRGVLMKGLGLFHIKRYTIHLILKRLTTTLGSSKVKIDYFKELYKQMFDKEWLNDESKPQ